MKINLQVFGLAFFEKAVGWAFFEKAVGWAFFEKAVEKSQALIG